MANAYDPSIGKVQAPPKWINRSDPIYDGDIVIFACDAHHFGSVFRVGNSSNLNYQADFIITQSDMGTNKNLQWQTYWRFQVRKVYFSKELQTWGVKALDLHKREVIPSDWPILIMDLESNKVWGTDVPGHSAPVLTNGDYHVNLYDLKLENISHTCENLGFRSWTSTSCRDYLDEATLIWYFHGNVGYDQNLNVLNMYTKVANADKSFLERWGQGISVGFGFGAAVHFEEGRALTTKAANDGTLKLAGINALDREIQTWKIFPYTARFPCPRIRGNEVLPACRPGEIRQSSDGSCQHPVPCKLGSFINQLGNCQQGLCPQGPGGNTTRDPYGYCNMPSANPTVGNGEYNVFFNEPSHKQYLLNLALAERQRLIEEQKAKDAMPCPLITEKKDENGICRPAQLKVLVEGKIDELTGETYTKKKCPLGTEGDPESIGGCVALKTGLVNDQRTWWEALFEKIFGSSYYDIPYIFRFLFVLGLFAGAGLIIFFTFEDVIQDAVHEIEHLIKENL